MFAEAGFPVLAALRHVAVGSSDLPQLSPECPTADRDCGHPAVRGFAPAFSRVLLFPDFGEEKVLFLEPAGFYFYTALLVYQAWCFSTWSGLCFRPNRSLAGNFFTRFSAAC